MPDMKTFVRGEMHHGIYAVMLLEDFDRMMKLPPGNRTTVGPIFLFARDDHFVDGSRSPWLAGNLDLMEDLLRPHVVVAREMSIPFSNGPQLYGDYDSLLTAFGQIGTLAEAIEVFGLVVNRELVPA